MQLKGLVGGNPGKTCTYQLTHRRKNYQYIYKTIYSISIEPFTKKGVPHIMNAIFSPLLLWKTSNLYSLQPRSIIPYGVFKNQTLEPRSNSQFPQCSSAKSASESE